MRACEVCTCVARKECKVSRLELNTHAHITYCQPTFGKAQQTREREREREREWEWERMLERENSGLRAQG